MCDFSFQCIFPFSVAQTSIQRSRSEFPRLRYLFWLLNIVHELTISRIEKIIYLFIQAIKMIQDIFNSDFSILLLISEFSSICPVT